MLSSCRRPVPAFWLVLLLSGCASVPQESAGWCLSQSSPAIRHPILRLAEPRRLPGPRTPPRFPEAARDAGLGAEVALRVIVDGTGSVVMVEPVRTIPLDPATCRPFSGQPTVIEGRLKREFEEAAMEAAVSWRYVAAVVDGHPAVASCIELVRFCNGVVFAPG